MKACRVKPTSHKATAIVKGKLISCRSAEEAEFLDDLSGVREGDQLFTKYAGNSGGVKTRKELTDRMVRDQLQMTAALKNLNPNYFSSPPFWKGVTNQLRAQGASDADIRDRGNKVVGSEVPRLTYDY